MPEVGEQLSQPVPKPVRVALRLCERLWRHRLAVGVENPTSDDRNMALYLDDGDPVAGVGGDDIELIVTLAVEPDVGNDNPPVGQPVTQRTHHQSLLVVGEQRHRKVCRYEDPHTRSLAWASIRLSV